MVGRTFYIIFREDKAFLCPGIPLDFGRVELPAVARWFDPPVHWLIRVLHHDLEESRIFADVVSYHHGDRAFPASQQEWFDELGTVEKVGFRNIDTNKLLRAIKPLEPQKRKSSPSGKTVTKGPEPAPEKGTMEEQAVHPEYSKQEEPPSGEAGVQEPPPPPVRRHRESFTIPLKNVRFKLGGVSFHKKLEVYPYEIEFEITNYDIREEFDAIKNYFSNILKTKKIDVEAEVEITGVEVTSQKARSPQIDRINPELIESVKFEFVKKTMKSRIVTEVDKSLFTMDEYFDTYSDGKSAAASFFHDECDLLENLLQITSTKHYKQLRYLSSRHAHNIMKLRFVHKPFSFIFLLEGRRNYHVVWETLDTTEATYIWHVEKDIAALRRTLHKIEDILNTIKVQGRTAYINSHDEPFRRIFHDYSHIVEGFVKWKGELDSFIT